VSDGGGLLQEVNGIAFLYSITYINLIATVRPKDDLIYKQWRIGWRCEWCD